MHVREAYVQLIGCVRSTSMRCVMGAVCSRWPPLVRSWPRPLVATGSEKGRKLMCINNRTPI
eukprot:scaffold291111_cov13-Tisochrysis_lutea.AAC.1